MKEVSRNIKFLRKLYVEKGATRSMLESGNVAFIKFRAPGHFYSPIPDLGDINSKAQSIFDNSIKDIPSINLNEGMQIELAKRLSTFYSDLPFTDTKTEDLRYYSDNSYFSYGDGIILYSFLRYFTPTRIIEVGSGHSSALMMDTNDIFLNKGINFTFIEPFPDRLFGLISENDKKKVRIEIKSVQDVELSVFNTLEANDILFVDSSHVAKINSDVLHIVFQILPRLKKGVIIHFHDISWPFEYPINWLEEGRAWNEAYFLRSFLQNNDAFEILYFNSYMALHHTNMLAEMMPNVLKVPTSKVTPGNTSLWIRRVV